MSKYKSKLRAYTNNSNLSKSSKRKLRAASRLEKAYRNWLSGCSIWSVLTTFSISFKQFNHYLKNNDYNLKLIGMLRD